MNVITKSMNVIKTLNNIETARIWAVGITFCMVVLVVVETVIAKLRRGDGDATFNTGVLELVLSVGVPSFAFIIANGAVSRLKKNTTSISHPLAPLFVLGLLVICSATVLVLGWYSAFATSHVSTHLGGGVEQLRPVPFHFGDAANVIGMITSPTLATMLALQVFSAR